jgi:hypothetical protein
MALIGLIELIEFDWTINSGDERLIALGKGQSG